VEAEIGHCLVSDFVGGLSWAVGRLGAQVPRSSYCSTFEPGSAPFLDLCRV
jgi:hypothetical protein